MLRITLQQFSELGWKPVLDLTDWWVQVTDDSGASRFEIKRGSLFVFENETLPRTGWEKFKNKALADKLNFLACGVVVLTVENEDMFLVRLPDALS